MMLPCAEEVPLVVLRELQVLPGHQVEPLQAVPDGPSLYVLVARFGCARREPKLKTSYMFVSGFWCAELDVSSPGYAHVIVRMLLSVLHRRSTKQCLEPDSVLSRYRIFQGHGMRRCACTWVWGWDIT